MVYPAKPLLEGTQRAFLINKGIVIPKDIIVEEVFVIKDSFVQCPNPLWRINHPITPQTIVRSSEKTIGYLNKKVPIIWHLSIQSIVRIQII